jgi:phage baseplate assembly protein W
MHLDYPFRASPGGRSAVTDDDDRIRDLIEQVLFTAAGERVNRPSFGSGVLRLVFEPGGQELATATQFLVQSSLQQWLADEVEVQAVDVVMDADQGLLRVAVRYRARTAPAPATAVFTRAV